jgi:fatty-acyl-CoA synthase
MSGMRDTPERRQSKSSKDAWLRALARSQAIASRPGISLPVAIEEVARAAPTSVSLIGEREVLTYQALMERARRYTSWVLHVQLQQGDVVCFLMQNCPEYFAVWLGITRAGGVVALLNTNLRHQSLRHAINTVGAQHIIVGADLIPALDGVLPYLQSRPTVWVQGGVDARYRCIDELPDAAAEDDLRKLEARAPDLADRALCIYTSGTTGMPKAANVSHHRLLQWSYWFAGMMDARPVDRMYNCLPMYHSTGGVVALGAMLISGGSVVIRSRFSARGFWDDVVSSHCTVFQYIGELCRYLVNNPVHPCEAAHNLRLCCGNGLRPDIWSEFRRRFRIPEHLEFYAATEANFSLFNCEAEPGSIGRIPAFLAHRFPVSLVKFDFDKDEPARGADGLCITCAANEVGEAISRISANDGHAGGRFEGYTDTEASEKKVLRDVFTHGDAWFRSGDLMRKDARGFYYFIDRIGDTFRWHGENVSTMEVAEALCGYPGVAEAVVYGVEMPGADGRAGMASVVVRPEFDLAAFRKRLEGLLADYARPVFLRVRDTIEATATFKHEKRKLVRDGYDPTTTADPIYVNDRGRKAYIRIDPLLHARIVAGEFRL